MKRSHLVQLPLFGALVLGACATAATPDASDTRRQYADGLCVGVGEIYHRGTTNVPHFPSDATITRRIHQRGWEGLCYTTPQSLRAAAQTDDT